MSGTFPASSTNLTTLAQLQDAGLLAQDLDPTLTQVAQRYAIGLTPHMANLIDRSNAADPIGAQFIPSPKELHTLEVEILDPIDDAGFSPLPGLVHRYSDRVLLKVVSVCPVYCRFCFRREMVGPGGPNLTRADLAAAIAYIAAHPEIFEVILTGGDPFMLSPRRVGELTQALAAIEHVKIVRWHTRVPIVDPDRVTPAFIETLKAPEIATWVAIHANHAQEFSKEAQSCVRSLADAGIALVSQSVLLKGINDNLEALQDLMRMFFGLGIKPYYLHHPDLAPGTSHFRLPIKKGQALMRALRKTMSGLAQPTYVLDIPGGAFKAPLETPHVREASTGLQLLDGKGVWHDYKG
ncbi:lysine 2,3-aminomutase [Candidatus Phycosocius spiralis]|uniref:Lysine 2,3-aminomutase n=1 Tax=Candidatus Phycosocius spiralis TaxID=2815099 RepID=A0ABQ4PXQ4_9PROT|nr:lysine 2,3-aminomutase [Candidatus Phycosocius spiralis]